MSSVDYSASLTPLERISLQMQYRPVSEGAPTGSALPLRDEVIEGIQQKKRFTGQAREYRLAVLASLVNDHHNLAHKALQNYLDNVYFAGEALEEAKRLLGGRGKWGRWLEANFPKSGETSRFYRRVYREWNDPRFVEARASDAPPRTLNAVLRVLRGQPIERHFEQDELDADQINRKQVCRWFADFVDGLNKEEAEILFSRFCGKLLPRWHEEFRHEMCVVTESDYYDDQGDIKSEARGRVLAALNP